jgi:signal peptidase I
MSLAVETSGESGQLAGRPTLEPPVGSLVPPAEPGTELPAAAVGAGGITASVSASPHRHSLLQAFQSLIYIIVIALFTITFTVQPFQIPSESMEPTLLVGDFLLVNKQIGLEVPPRVLAPESLIHRGDLIVFHYPIDASLHLVKRVIGLPGDHVRLHAGHAYIDGRPLAEPYAIFRPSSPDSYRDDFPHMTSVDPGVDARWWVQMHSLVSNGQLVVPADSYFVLGDNRNDSEDSRYWGFVPRPAIVGKPFLIYFSLNENRDPGQIAATKDNGANGEPSTPAGSLVDFARWDRALRIIY